MNPFDSGILLWLNQFLGIWGTGDSFVKVISDNSLMQGVVPITALWFLWFRQASPSETWHTRELVVTTLIAAFVAVLVARSLASALPYRTRPIYEPALAFHNVYPGWGKDLFHWSSFPSDHAVLMFALATGATVINRGIGILLLLHAAIIDCLPRIYLGFHYPTDILAGALLGIVMVYFATRDPIRRPLSAPFFKASETWPGLFYAAMFLFTFEVATMFDSAAQMLDISYYLGRSIYMHAF